MSEKQHDVPPIQKFLKHRSALLSVASLFLLIVVGRTIFVSLYAESIPFWDQWDAEGRYLIKPWLEGTLGFNQLFAAHNEHRIFFTRLLSLVQLELNNGQWDNMVGAYANVLLYATIPLLLFIILAPGLHKRYEKILIFLVLLALAWLPYGWENTLVGFQSQFYLMSLFAIASIFIASCSKDTSWLPAKLFIPSFLGLFTMAAGLLGPIAAGLVIVIRTITGQIRIARAGLLLLMLISISIFALITLPHVAEHDVFKAKGLTDWIKRLLPILGWPSPFAPLLWPIIWLPSLLTIWHLLKCRQASKYTFIALGLSFWTLLQIAGIAYSRGTLSSRYLDIVSIGLTANLWMALSLLAHQRQAGIRSLQIYTRWLLLSAFLLTVSWGFLYSTPLDIANAKERLQLSTWQTINVRNAVLSGNQSYLYHQPALHIPYPSADILATLLADTTLRSALPASVRPPLSLAPDQSFGAFHTLNDRQGALVTSCNLGAACLTGIGSWQSQAISTSYPYIEVPLSIKGTNSKGIGIGLVQGKSDVLPEEIPNDYIRYMLANPVRNGSFYLVATDSSAQAALKMRFPVEVGRLSYWAMSLQDQIRSHLGYPTSDYLQRARVLITSPASDTGNTAIQLLPQQVAQLEWTAPQDGELSAIALSIGNYQNSSNGTINIQVCTKEKCQLAHGDLSKSVDNSNFELPLNSPLALYSGEPMTFRIWTSAATKPVALWSSSYVEGAAEIKSLPDLSLNQINQKTLRLTLVFEE